MKLVCCPTVIGLGEQCAAGVADFDAPGIFRDVHRTRRAGVAMPAFHGAVFPRRVFGHRPGEHERVGGFAKLRAAADADANGARRNELNRERLLRVGGVFDGGNLFCSTFFGPESVLSNACLVTSTERWNVSLALRPSPDRRTPACRRGTACWRSSGNRADVHRVIEQRRGRGGKWVKTAGQHQGGRKAKRGQLWAIEIWFHARTAI